jgi:hypothetical protein
MARWTAGLLLIAMSALAQGTDGYWTPEKARAVLDKMRTIRLAPEVGGLTANERAALADLVEVGKIFQSVYEEQLHPQAHEALAKLTALNPPRKDLLDLYRLFRGPIATTLENKREAFVPVQPETPGKNVYPAGMKKEEMDRFLAAHSEKRDSLLHPRTVVRRATAENLRADLAKLREYPVLDTLHPGLRRELTEAVAKPDAGVLYAIPYSLAYADQMIRAHSILNRAADRMAKDDPEFAGYLRNRSRDLLSNDYESGDASWVTGRFKKLNAQIGAYETYDDALYGVKAFYAFNVLVALGEDTVRLRSALKGCRRWKTSCRTRRTSAFERTSR